VGAVAVTLAGRPYGWPPTAPPSGPEAEATVTSVEANEDEDKLFERVMLPFPATDLEPGLFFTAAAPAPMIR
jgi:hypothetical protein